MAKLNQPPPALPSIYTVRGRKVVLDAELAKLYGVQPKRLNEAVQRNTRRFPDDFSFFITREELGNLKSQIAASSGHENPSRSAAALPRESQHGGRRKPVRAFTEHGALMAANVLRS